MYAQLCNVLAANAEAFQKQFLQIEQRDDGWWWTAGLKEIETEVALEEDGAAGEGEEGKEGKEGEDGGSAAKENDASGDVSGSTYDASGNVKKTGKTKTVYEYEPIERGPFEQKEDARKHGLKSTSFNRMILNKCQTEFQKAGVVKTFDEKIRAICKGRKQMSLSREEKKTLAPLLWDQKQVKKRVLANINFIGELFKEGMLTEKIMHECIGKLLNPKAPDSEETESLCRLLTTIGLKLDTTARKSSIKKKHEQLMIKYMKGLNEIGQSMKVPARIRFGCQAVIEMRKNGWIERRKKLKAKKISEVHEEAAAEAAAEEQQKQMSKRGKGGYGGRGDRRGGRDGYRGRDNNRGGGGRRDNSNLLPAVTSSSGNRSFLGSSGNGKGNQRMQLGSGDVRKGGGKSSGSSGAASMSLNLGGRGAGEAEHHL